MSATVTSLNPVAATAAMTDRSSRSRCAARTVSGGSPFLPRGRPGSPSWVRARTPSCLLLGTLLNLSNALKYVIVLMWGRLRSPLRGPHDCDCHRSGAGPPTRVMALETPARALSRHRHAGALPRHHGAGHRHAVLRALCRRVGGH